MAKKPTAQWPFDRVIAGFVTLAVIIAGISGGLWWHKLHNDPQHVFQQMLQTSLSTSSVTRHITQTTNQSGSLDQITRLNLGGQSTAQALTTIQQPSATGTNTVVTEKLGTASNNYDRFLAIDTQQKNQTGQPLNYSSLLGIWGKSDVASGSDQPNTQFLNVTILDAIPFAPLSSQQRQQVLQVIRQKKVYTIDYSKVTSRKLNGRSVFVYQVSKNVSAYVSMLKTLTHQLGITQLDNFNPTSYAEAAPEQLEITVDKLSYQLTQIRYVASQYEETYTGYGLQAAVDVPTATIPVTELQQRLQSVQ